MDANRFDAMTRTFAHRLSRRGALAGGAELGAALMGHGVHSAHAQDATPIVGATPESGETAEVLYVQSFASGSMVANGADGFTLTLEGGTGQTVYFSERPERLVGTVTDEQFLDGRAFDPADPPNAAIVTKTADGEDILVVELTNPGLDATSGAVSYTARPLDGQPEGAALANLATRQADESLDETFGSVTLFIDQLACRGSGSDCSSNKDCCSGTCCDSNTMCLMGTCVG